MTIQKREAGPRAVAPTTTLVRRPSPAPARVGDVAEPHGEYRVRDDIGTLSLEPGSEPVLWWVFLLPVRATLMFLLWATRSPDRALIAAMLLVALAAIVLTAWMVS
jgi:hypothetical protein